MLSESWKSLFTMTNKPFLHQLPSFTLLVTAYESQTKISAQLIEKDYWLMHVLWGLQHAGLSYELKGGTSLSKGWNLTRRFSEDIDIKIFAPTGMTVHVGKNHSEPRHKKSRSAYFEWLLGKLNIPGAVYVKRDTDFDDHDLRNAGYRIGYKSAYDPFGGLKTDILLEVGFDTTTPNTPLNISSWVYDLAIKEGLVLADNRAIAVPCYAPEYTFVEKLSAISKKYRQEVGGKTVQNFTRHYYDIFQLLGESRVQNFIGTKEYLDHKTRRFSSNDELEIKRNPAFTLPDKLIRKKFSDRLIRSEGLYFEGQPSIEAILARIETYLDRL